jgi:hypothetical protein
MKTDKETGLLKIPFCYFENSKEIPRKDDVLLVLNNRTKDTFFVKTIKVEGGYAYVEPLKKGTK